MRPAFGLPTAGSPAVPGTASLWLGVALLAYGGFPAAPALACPTILAEAGDAIEFVTQVPKLCDAHVAHRRLTGNAHLEIMARVLIETGGAHRRVGRADQMTATVL